MAAWRRRLRRAIPVLASATCVLATAEAGIRLLHLAPLRDGAVAGFPIDHPLRRLLHSNVCETTGRLQAASYVEVCTNGVGLRDRDHPAGESPRILVLGDAATFGAGVELGDTFSSHLERELRLALPTVRAGVWNAGLPFTSQVHQEALLRHWYDAVRPDAVVVAFAEDDDIDENVMWNPALGSFPGQGEISQTNVDAFRSELLLEPSRGFLARHSALIRLLGQGSTRASLSEERDALHSALEAHGLTRVPRSEDAADVERRRFMQAYSRKNEADWRVTEIVLDRMWRFVDERKGKLVLLRIPGRVAVDDTAWASARSRFCGDDVRAIQSRCGTLDRRRTASRLAAFADRRGVAYVDPEEHLKAAARRGEALYSPDDAHLTRLAHWRLAERLSPPVVRSVGAEPEPRANAPELPEKERRVGAYWYPWYRVTDWSSFTDYAPKGGAHLSTDPDAILRQLHWAERGEIDFLMIELLADHNPESRFNNQAIDTLLSSLEERRRRGFSRMGFAVMSDIFIGEGEIGTADRWLEATRRHLDEIWTRFVEPHRDAYVHVQGKPLVAIYSPPCAIEDSRFTIVRPYWVAHDQWRDWSRKNELVPFWDTYPQVVTDGRFVGVVPGYNDWRLERHPQVAPYLPRAGGRTFVEQWRRAFEVNPDVVLVYGYNEYFEQTQIEPTMEQGDRYLMLNEILARRFKDGRTLTASEAERLADTLEPPAKPSEEKAFWFPIDDPRIKARGLMHVGPGRAALVDRAEVALDVEGDRAFVVGIGHDPTFDHCVGISVTLGDGDATQTAHFSTESTQLTVLREFPLASDTGHIKLILEREPVRPGCSEAGDKPIVLTGVARYPLGTAERSSFPIDSRSVRLEGFWGVENQAAGAYAWSRDRATITLSGLTPGASHRVTLTFRDTAGFGNVEIGPDAERLASVVITPGRTSTAPAPFAVAADGTLRISLKTPTWRPSERFHSKDDRALGIAVRLITLDRIDEAAVAHVRN